MSRRSAVGEAVRCVPTDEVLAFVQQLLRWGIEGARRKFGPQFENNRIEIEAARDFVQSKIKEARA